MILTKHNQNLTPEPAKEKRTVLFALRMKSRSSKDVKHIGLKPAIASHINKKYKNIKIKFQKKKKFKFEAPIGFSHGNTSDLNANKRYTKF